MSELRFNEVINKHAPLDDYEQGWVDAVFAYAWMKDGAYYVGSTGWPLGAEVDKFLTNRRQRLQGTEAARG